MTNKVKNIDLENCTHWFFDDIMGGYKLPLSSMFIKAYEKLSRMTVKQSQSW